MKTGLPNILTVLNGTGEFVNFAWILNFSECETAVILPIIRHPMPPQPLLN